MSHKIIHRGKELTITINGKTCQGIYGQTILEIARENNIYIPTMCYLTKVNPISSCRMCVVAVDGIDGMVLSCQEKAVNGASITTDTPDIFKHRQNIMKLYNVNHPLQCGVCDKSGECELQNKTLEFGLKSQEFSAKEIMRKKKKWGVLGYDPYLCIMCERCVHTCNEVVGTESLYIKPGGYKSEIDINYSKCIQCGECISVCPVGALTSSAFKYKANAWEARKIPSTCAHCSSGCELYYEVKSAGIAEFGKEKISRVTNDFETESLCGAGRFSFDFYLNGNYKDETKFSKTIEAFKKADTIKFNSYITNEEAKILQTMKERFGYKLVNNDALNYQRFLNAYSCVVGKSLYSATLDDIKKSDFIVCVGTKIANDNPMVKFHINMASKQNQAEFIYAHPIFDDSIKSLVTQFVKYEVGSEDGFLALLAKSLCVDLSDDLKVYFDNLDDGYISAESNVGEEEIAKIKVKQKTKSNKVLIAGADLFAHEKAENIAKLVGVLEKFGGFKVLIIPSQTNSLGVAKICDLDSDSSQFSIGYNANGDFCIGSDAKFELTTPALNQQEGTFATIDKKVKAINVAINFDGYCLNDIANALDINSSYTIGYTSKLPIDKGFKEIEFDDLKDGYALNSYDSEAVFSLEDIDELKSYNGTVVYLSNAMNQFNYNTAKSKILKPSDVLIGSPNFASVAKIQGGDLVNVDFGNYNKQKLFKLDKNMRGTVASYDFFDELLSSDLVSSAYKYQKVKISRVEKL